VNNTHGVWARVGATVGTALPIFNLFFIWKLLSSVRGIAKENKLPSRFSVRYLFLVYQLFSIGRFIFDRFDKDVRLQTGPDAVSYFALSLVLLFAPLLALYPVQRSINDYWTARQNLPERKSLTAGEIIVAAFGCSSRLGFTRCGRAKLILRAIQSSKKPREAGRPSKFCPGHVNVTLFCRAAFVDLAPRHLLHQPSHHQQCRL
jgi:hypothetical protein